MLLDLTVRELEHLQAISVGRLSCPRLGEVVNNLAIWVRLLDVIIVEVDDGVSISESFSANAVAKDDFFLAVGVCALNLAVVANDALDSLLVLIILAMVLVEEFHLVVLFFVLHVITGLFSVLFVASNIIRMRVVVLLLIQSVILVLSFDIIVSVFCCLSQLLADLFFLILEFFHAWLHIVILVTLSLATSIQALTGPTATTLALLSATSRASTV